MEKEKLKALEKLVGKKLNALLYKLIDQFAKLKSQYT